MAFRIRNENELSLLDDNQRKQYESELDIYRERTAFVQQLERHSDTTIPPFKPKLQSINVIHKIEEKKYKSPEYVLTVCEPSKKLELKEMPSVAAEPINPVLPVLSKRPKLSVKRMKSLEKTQPKLPPVGKALAPAKKIDKIEINEINLPEIAKASIAVKTYIPPERKQLVLPLAAKASITVKSYMPSERKQLALPQVAKPRMQTNLNVKPVSIDISNIKMDSSKVVIPITALHPIVVPKRVPHELQDVTVKFSGVRHYSKPELPAAKLPEAAKPDRKVNTFGKLKPIQATLPDVPDIVPVKAAFEMPKLAEVKSHTVVKPSVNIPVVGEIQPAIPGLPEISKIQMKSPNFNKPMLAPPELPLKPTVYVPSRTLKPIEETKPDLVTMKLPIVKIKSLAKIEKQQITDLPNKTVVVIPDAHEKLKDLLMAGNGKLMA